MRRTVDSLANERVYTTFVGIGVDFDTSLTKRIATITACNYLSVSSTKEFKKARPCIQKLCVLVSAVCVSVYLVWF